MYTNISSLKPSNTVQYALFVMVPFTLLMCVCVCGGGGRDKLDILHYMVNARNVIHSVCPPHLHPCTASALFDAQQWQQLTVC